jgi:hypothetical protein
LLTRTTHTTTTTTITSTFFLPQGVSGYKGGEACSVGGTKGLW